ncbi:MAG: DUF4358 domain-containing protein [Terrisporobacter othiniensis]|uniref:DUF4358 domain-containing protein n=1 Tax=Terrisporobacter petrolearius TaxID=1460447 RepID=UPI001D15ED0D|nr:DUF4358 domain-containing protein [Terrisporobacter petrolearius]MCC3863957.1 DUF4358 domain-containing protein [Terrisporobacter petrolearius]MDU4860221.1 DUF4358 domain-containing protein [Terrisporobacter othiniensis]MDU6996362.1 DUF4358 domain-containing protein [Terrisporobacter othiniensis]
MKINLKKKLLMATLLITTVITVGCGVNNDQSVDKIENEMKQKVKFDKMEKGDSKSLKRFYKLNANDYDGVILYTPQSTMDVNEVLIVKVKDKSQIEPLEDSIDSRINYQLQSFSGYGPEQCALVDNYELKSKGNFVFFAVSENAQQIKEAFLDSIKQ